MGQWRKPYWGCLVGTSYPEHWFQDSNQIPKRANPNAHVIPGWIITVGSSETEGAQYSASGSPGSDAAKNGLTILS